MKEKQAYRVLLSRNYSVVKITKCATTDEMYYGYIHVCVYVYKAYIFCFVKVAEELSLASNKVALSTIATNHRKYDFMKCFALIKFKYIEIYNNILKVLVISLTYNILY